MPSPPDQDLYVMVSAIQMLLRAGLATGLSRTEMLAMAGLSEEDLADRDLHRPVEHQIRLGMYIVQSNPNTNIALVALEHFIPATLGILGYALQHCPTLASMIHTFCRYQQLVTNVASWEFEEQKGILQVETPMMGPAVEMMLLMILKLGRSMTGEGWNARRLQVRHEALGDPTEYPTKLGIPVEFSAPVNALEIDPALLSLPVTHAQPGLLPGLKQFLEHLTDLHPDSVTRRLRKELERRLPEGCTDRTEYAVSLGLSDRSLNRKLKAEGTSFRQELEAVRRELAELHLRAGQLAIYEIAFLLGYSEPTSLHRSFQRWHGMSPQVWRSQHAP